MKILFLTGRPGCGKSTLIKQLIKELQAKQKKIAGIISPEIRTDSRKGFEIIDIVSGDKAVLASTEIREGPRVSKYRVNIKGINKIVDKFLASFDKADYIFIDELGKMELFSEKFKDMIDSVLSSDKTIIIALYRNLIDKYKSKGRIFYIEREKINKLKEQILKEIEKR